MYAGDEWGDWTQIVRTLEMAKSSHLMPDHYLINAVPLGVAIDDQSDWVDHPVGMAATHINGHYHLMMLPINTMQNLERAMKAAGVGIERMIVSSLATAEAVLLPDEREYGVCLVDIGAGTTNMAVYLEGRLILSHTIQRGGRMMLGTLPRYCKPPPSKPKPSRCGMVVLIGQGETGSNDPCAGHWCCTGGDGEPH